MIRQSFWPGMNAERRRRRRIPAVCGSVQYQIQRLAAKSFPFQKRQVVEPMNHLAAALHSTHAAALRCAAELTPTRQQVGRQAGSTDNSNRRKKVTQKQDNESRHFPRMDMPRRNQKKERKRKRREQHRIEK